MRYTVGYPLGISRKWKDVDPVATAIIQVDPRTLRLPPERLQGADHRKFWRQIATHGKSTDGMLPVWVSRGKDGELQILDGVTRATRVAKLLPG